MKFLPPQLTYLLTKSQTRQNINALLKYLVFLVATILIYSIIFHFIMLYVEGREFSWITGFYWTLTVMSTLGFGDITFESDIGRVFSMIVLLSGIILLLIMLPFTFIRFFYAPWLEAQIHTKAPREIPPDTEGHVIICRYDTIAPNLIKRLKQYQIPYYLIESDSATAGQMYQDGISVVCGNVDDRKTYGRLRADKARFVFANAEDTTNTNIILTVREVAPKVPIAAVADDEDSIDILELSGATHVLPLKHQLGENLAKRISFGGKRTNVIRRFDDWRVFEFTIHNTRLAGKKLRDTEIRKLSGANVIGVWERGCLIPADANTHLSDRCVLVAIGTDEQVEKLEELLTVSEPDCKAVLILGAGKVGRAAARSLKMNGQKVFMVDKNEEMREKIGDIPDRLVIGDAADRKTLDDAGLDESSLVILSTNNDAVNIYLSIYCRRLNPDVRIVSRITHAKNVEAIHRAGADFVLSFAPLGGETVLSLIQGREPLIMGAGVEIYTVRLPFALEGKSLGESRIGSRTGMIVLTIQTEEETIANPPPGFVLSKNCRVTLLGTTEQLQNFSEAFK